MKKLFKRILLSCAVIMTVCACEKDSLSPSADTADVQSGHLVDIMESVYISDVDSLYSYLVSGLVGEKSRLLEFVSRKMFKDEIHNLELRNYLDVGLNPDCSSRLCFERHRFTFSTTDVNGMPIVLSGNVIFPNNTDPSRVYEVDNITLFNNLLIPQADGNTGKGLLAMFRVIFNSMVVIPDQEGYGVTYGERRPMDFGYNCVAHQSVDCVLAALELLREREAGMKKDYVTYNIGSSRGGYIALAIQKYIETEAPAEVCKALNLRGSFCSSAPLDVYGLLKHYCSPSEQIPFYWMIPVLTNTLYDANPDCFRDFRHEDLYSEEYIRSDYSLAQYGCTLDELICRMNCAADELNEILENSGMKRPQDMLNARMFDAAGNLDESDALVKAICRASEENNPAVGWTPRLPLLLKYSRNDDIIPFEMAYASFKELSRDERGLPVRNVVFSGAGIGGHVAASILDIGECIMSKDPLDRYFR